MRMSNNYDDLRINEYSQKVFYDRRKKILREGGIYFYDLAEDLVRKIIDLISISTEVPDKCDINSIELKSSKNGNFAFSFYMRNGEHHDSLETLEKYENLYVLAKRITDTKYNSLVLFEAMKIWEKLDNYYISSWQKGIFENSAEKVKFNIMQ